MHPDRLKTLLHSVARGEIVVEKALDSLKHLTVEDIGYAHIDHHRSLRKGFPEVIYGENKNAAQIIGIMAKMMQRENVILVTRIDAAKARQVQDELPDIIYHADAGMLVWAAGEIPVTGKGTILVISAGTSDIPVAREAFLTARAMGNTTQSIFDVGVAGIHRLFAYKNDIETAAVLIVVAGMEGALPSVVAGIVDKPVIGVPTSVGYGASLGGLTALFSMLNSCSSNVAVVNIDNGFGAGYMASMINRL
jgi:pyridinium-3,5-biscarboxylic acid mononucleotide synthase